jgi:hypothetical protein
VIEEERRIAGVSISDNALRSAARIDSLNEEDLVRVLGREALATVKAGLAWRMEAFLGPERTPVGRVLSLLGCKARPG